MSRMTMHAVGVRVVLSLLVAVSLSACGGQRPGAVDPGKPVTLRLYTAVSQEPVDAAIAAFVEREPTFEVEVFRAPTAELNGRIAAERREGRIGADLLWMADPLSMQRYAADGLLREWQPSAIDMIPDVSRSDVFWGTHLLEVVAVHGDDVEPAPSAWNDLADPAYDGAVAIPDPAFAGSAFGALGYFAMTDGFGLDFYRRLAENGAVQVNAPTEVLTGVAEGRFDVGMTLSFAARDAIESGAPIKMVRPAPGAIAVYSPIGIVVGSDHAERAEEFVNFLLSAQGQRILADVGGYEPIRDDVEGPARGAPHVSPDWEAAFNRQDELLEEYRTIFGND